MSNGTNRRQQDEDNSNDDPRFQQLLQAARDGDENAVADLWREFGFRFEEGQP